ncbi:hypothetical protein BTVI_26380 [Pitangus sulphuratus]|nr:hypothetical protein BTVI_26380 [Pitangus sulphuratus]
MLDHLFHEEIPPDVQPDPPLAQHFPCSITMCTDVSASVYPEPDTTPWMREFGPLGSPALLLPVLCLGLWAQQSLALQCQDGERKIIIKDAEKCCPKCNLEAAPPPPSSLSTTILAILTAVAVFVLILLTFLLHFCIWTLKGKYFVADDVDHHSPRPPAAAPQLPPQGDESHSIQFPEEEHGDKAAQEKLSMLSLKVSSDIS